MSRTYHHGDKAKQRKFGDSWRWMGGTPSDWNNTFHTKPKRAENKQLTLRTIRGEYELVWPVGSRKPHTYYW